MGMTIWIHTLEGRNYSKDSDDHSLMNRHADALDALCEEIGARKLSEYMDFTEQQFDFDEFNDGDDEPELDPETELAYGIDDMTWFEASAGLASLRAVRDRIATAGIASVETEEIEGLLEELDDCIAVLDGPASRGGKFHLTVIE